MKRGFFQIFFVLGTLIFCFSTFAPISLLGIADAQTINDPSITRNQQGEQVKWTNAADGQDYIRINYDDGYTLLIKDNLLSNTGDLYAPGTDLSDPNKKPVETWNSNIVQEINMSARRYKAPEVQLTGQPGDPNRYEMATDEWSIQYWIERGMAFLLKTWLQVITGALAIVGELFDKVVTFTLDNSTFQSGGKNGANLGPTVDTLWKFIRDLANIVIVFSMLYLAIRTILDGEGFADKSKLANVLLAAILINFSLFATKAAFTISNSVATEIKSKIVINETGGVAAGATTTASTNAHSLSAGIARTLGIPKTVEYISDESLGGSKNLSDYQAIQFQYMLMLTFSVIGVGFILVAGALMLLYRFIMFIFLIILAPIGLVCFFIPWLKKYGQEWVDKVKALTLMAPVYFLSFYVSMLLLSQVVALGNVTTGGFVAALVQMATQTLLIAGTLFATIMLPIKVSSAGGEFIGNMGKWTEGKFRSLGKAPQQAALWGARKSGEYTARGVGRIGRSTIGKGADRFLKNNEWLKRNVTEAGIGGAVARGVARRAGDLATSSFDPRSVKIGGKAIGEKMGIGKPTKGQEDGYRGVATAKAKDIKKRFDSDMKIFGDAYEAKEKESRRENAKRASTEVDAAKNKIIQMQISGANQDDLTKAQMEVDSAKKKHAEALKMLDFKQNKIGNKEKGKLYAGVLDSDRNSKWNKFVNIFDEGRRRSMKEGIKIINKEKTKNEEAAEALAKAIKDGNN